MMIDNSYFFYMLLSSNIALLAIVAVLLTRFELRWKRIDEYWDSPNEDESQQISDANYREHLIVIKNLERRLDELQRSLKVIEIEAPTQPPQTERKLPLDNAVRMAKLGASVDDLTRNCGLSIGEARLMHKLHGKTAIAVNGR